VANSPNVIPYSRIYRRVDVPPSETDYFGAPMMRTELLDRLVALPQRSHRRDRILKMFGCYSIGTVFVKVSASPEPVRHELEQRITAILDEPESETTDGE